MKNDAFSWTSSRAPAEKRNPLLAALMVCAAALALCITGCSVRSPLDTSLFASELESVPVSNLGTVNWPGDDYAPYISPHGRLLVFQSDRPGSHEGPNLWYSVNRNAPDRTGPADWTVPLPLTFPLPDTALDLEPMRDGAKAEEAADVHRTNPKETKTFAFNTDGFEGHPSLIFRGGRPVELYFTGMSKDDGARAGYDGLNIYFTRLRDGLWSAPEHLNVVNSDWNDRMPSISNDGKTLYFVSDRPGGFGGSDIWFSRRDLKTGRWTPAVNAGPAVNTEYNEITPHISSEGSLLFFSSDRPGGLGQYDLYVCRNRGTDFDAAENLGPPFN
ncbi:MAG: PD40 domain-containing protein, partial [Spirochaetia bacterium]|nr:PD40 domain-containing protein [Spirochaetia bacterium]